MGDASGRTGADSLVDALFVTALGLDHMGLFSVLVKGENLRAELNAGLTAYTFIGIDHYLFCHVFPPQFRSEKIYMSREGR